MTFEGDGNKSVENMRKHGVSFESAQQAFLDIKRKIYHDEKHSTGEDRYFCYGMVEGKILTVWFTVRGQKSGLSAPDTGAMEERYTMKTKNDFAGYTDAPAHIVKEMERAVKIKDFLPAPEQLKLKSVSEIERTRTNREWQRYRIKDQERGHRKSIAEILKEPTRRLDTSVILPESVYLWMKEKSNKAAFIRETVIQRYANDSKLNP